MPKSAVASEPTRRKVITTQQQTILTPEGLEPETEKAPGDQFEHQSLDVFFQRVNEKGWNKAMVYLYRQRPEDGNRRLGPYLEKLTEPMNEQQVREKFGGGNFRALANADGSLFAMVNFSIEGPPKILDRASGVQTDGAIVTVLKELVERVMESKEKGVDTKTAIEQAMAIQSRAYQTSLETIAAGKGDSTISQMIDGMAKLRELSGESGGGANSMNALMSQFLTAAIQKLLSPVDPMAQMKPWLEFARELRGGGEGGVTSGNWKVALANNLPEAMRMVKDVAQEWNKISENNRIVREIDYRLRTSTPASAAYPAPPPSTIRAATPQALRPSPAPESIAYETEPVDGAGMPAGASSNPLVSETAPPSLQTSANFAPETIVGPSGAWIKQQLVRQIQAGETGDAIGDWLDRTEPSYTNALAPLNVEQLLGVFGADPILSAVAQDPRLPQVLTEFLAFARDDTAIPKARSAKPN